MFGHYLTPGKRSPQVPPGIYEGEFNRKVAQTLSKYLNAAGIDALELTPGPVQIPLAARVKEVNRLYKVEKDIVLIDIHANAAGGGGWSDAHGFTIFHHPKASKTSKEIAAMVEDQMSKSLGILESRGIETGAPRLFAEVRERISSRGIKTALFKILKVQCAAILIECGFMTNLKEASYMATEIGVSTIADSIAYGIERFEADLRGEDVE